MKRHQAVAAHNPDELGLRAVLSQQLDQVIGITQTHLFFDGADLERTIVPGQGLDRREAGIIVARGFFERIAGRRKPPDRVQVQVFQCGAGDVNMAAVRRVETAPEQANPCPGCRGWQMSCRSVECHESDDWIAA